VPAGASAGAISVTTASGSTSSVGSFQVSHDRRVTIRLGRGMFASGLVHVADGFGMCRSAVAVAIQHRSAGAWHVVSSGVTDARGRYRLKVRHLGGLFRAMVQRTTLSSGDVCGGSISPPASG
jgi:hypothetical protein